MMCHIPFMRLSQVNSLCSRTVNPTQLHEAAGWYANDLANKNFNFAEAVIE
jgi:hypothetical protein